METKEMAKKGLYVGTGIGLILFALVGLFPGSMVGGVIGLKIAGSMLGAPVHATVLARLIVAAFMIIGVLTAAIAFILGTGIVGWLVGSVADTVKARHEVPAEAAAKR
ncbi:MAG: hypothetical protein C4560_01870 [Nitrospiraceae bacterium]|nr:MAG: hypothetical protein C4560_01870 [Nitrospiraceae bacterium]